MGSGSSGETPDLCVQIISHPVYQCRRSSESAALKCYMRVKGPFTLIVHLHQ